MQTENHALPATPGEFDNPNLTERLRQAKPLPWTLRDGIFLAAAAILGLLIVDWALWSNLGLGFTLCYALLLIWTAAYRGRTGARVRPIGLFCGVASLVGAGLFAWTTDFLLLFLWFWMILLLYCIFAASIFGVRLGDGPRLIIDALRLILPAPFCNLHRPFVSMAAAGNSQGGRRLRQVLMGLLLAAPVLAVVLPLLVNSDAAFEGLVHALVGNLGSVSYKLILGLVFAVLIFSLGFALRKGLVKAPARPEDSARGALGPAAAATLLVALLIVYGVYLLSQLAYFFSAFSGILPAGYVFSAAEYARRGFFELCGVCAVNLLVVCLVPWLARREGGVPLAIKLLCAAICAFCLIFAAVAFSKMALYVQRFGLTRLRLLVSAFMVLLVFVLVCALARLFAPRLPIVPLILALTCALALALGYAEPDALVARHNVERYSAGTLEEVDVGYLNSLSDAVVPQLAALLDCPDAAVRARAAASLSWRLDVLEDADLHLHPVARDFRSYNRSRAEAEELLLKNRARIEEILKESGER